MLKRFASVAVIAAIVVACSSGSGASPMTSIGPLADILTYKANAARTGEHPGPGPAKAPTQLWRVEHGSLFRTAPLITGGQLIAGSEDGMLFVIDAASGTPTKLDAATRFRPTGTIADGVFYVAGLDGGLSALKLPGGDAGWGVRGLHEESFTAISGDLVIAGAADDLVAYARADGQEKWRVAVAGSERMALGDGVVYAGGRESSKLTAVGLDGVKRWEFDTGAEEVLTPLVADGKVVIAPRGAADGGSTVTALDLDGAELWTADFDGTLGSHGTDGSRIYVTNQEEPSSMFALDLATGETMWQHDFEGLLVAVLAIAGDRVYSVTQAEGLVAVEAATGNVLWQVELGEVARAGLAVTGGLVFVTTEDFSGAGRVLAFR